MRMFVLDEQAFLKDPSGQSEEEEARAKRRFEQEELLQEGKAYYCTCTAEELEVNRKQALASGPRAGCG